MTLYGGLEEKMFGFNREDKYKTETDKLVDESRRNFMKSTMAVGIAAATAPFAAMYSKDANAEIKDWYNTLPPGFKLIVDKKGDMAVVNAYLEMMDRHTFDKENIAKGILTRNGQLVNVYTKVVSKETPSIEPAYWFNVNYFNYVFQQNGPNGVIDRVEFLAKKFNVSPNTPMYNWAKGINKYFLTWIARNKNWGSTIDTENYLLKAIFTAAGKSENEVDEYKKFDTNLKTRKLQEVMKSLEKQSYNNQLIAAWSVYCLGIHYEVKIKDVPESDIIYDQIEMPLRKINSKLKIRGPPSYGI